MATLTAEKAYLQVASHAENIKNDEHQRVKTCSPGDSWAQGDLLLVCLESLPRGCEKIADPQQQSQLAPGNTQGSRHVLASSEGVTQYRLSDATPLDGPILECRQGITIEHPEHGNVSLPAGVWGVVYQRAYAEELRRVQD